MGAGAQAGGGRRNVLLFDFLIFGSDEKQISGYTEKMIIIQLRTGEHHNHRFWFGFLSPESVVNK